MENLLDIKNLSVEYKVQSGISNSRRIIHAVNDISLTVHKGEILAIAGESGCGKSTLAKTIMMLEPAVSGEIFFKDTNILKLNKKELKEIRKKLQMIFQNPYASLNPKMKIIDILSEPLKINTEFSNEEIKRIVFETAEKVGIDSEMLQLYPHEFSGGQRQRIAIARALVMNPELVLADEPVSALDVSIQAQIINLLKDLKEDYNLTFVFISHDLGVIRYLSDRVAIMYLGEIVEIGTTQDIFFFPAHPYTKALLASVPEIIKRGEPRNVPKGDIPSPENLPDGCKFHTRCPHCMPICREKSPKNITLSGNHKVRCFLYDEKSVV